MGDQARELQNLMAFFKLDGQATALKLAVAPTSPSGTHHGGHRRRIAPPSSPGPQQRPATKNPVRLLPTDKKPESAKKNDEWEEF